MLLGTDLFRAGASGEPRRRRASRWRPADETFRRLGVLDELGLAVLPLLLGRGMQPAPSVGNDAALTLTGHRAPASEVGIRLPALADRPAAIEAVRVLGSSLSD